MKFVSRNALYFAKIVPQTSPDIDLLGWGVDFLGVYSIVIGSVITVLCSPEFYSDYG